MQSGLMLCDIGNSTLKIGLARNGRIIATYALPVLKGTTADSLGLHILDVLRHAGLEPSDFTGCAAVSVVPPMDSILAEAVDRYLDCSTLFAPSSLPVPLANQYRQPAEVGADRLVAAYAATLVFPDVTSLIVVDFGTAVTFDCVSDENYIGGLIFPGPATAAAALASHTAKLPHVSLDIASSEPIPGLDTATSIQHGLVFGYVCLTEGICRLLRRQLQEPVKVVATGGFASEITHLAPVFDCVVPNLLLDGLLSLYNQSCLAYGQP